ncbi:hypothetical protein XPR_4531, partial [Xanthomonas arboricola pv. pruni MAFF 301420]
QRCRAPAAGANPHAGVRCSRVGHGHGQCGGAIESVHASGYHPAGTPMAARGAVRRRRKSAQCQLPPRRTRHRVLSVRACAAGCRQSRAQPAAAGAAAAGL